MITNSQTRSISRVSPINITVVFQLILLLVAGGLATWLHYRFRIPLKMPGRHGLEFMLILMGARSLSPIRLSATVTIIGSMLVTLVPGYGFTDPILPYTYVMMGLLVDFAWHYWRNRKVLLWVVALLGGVSYALIPLARLLFSGLTGYYYGSLSVNPMWPIATHLLFGFIGAFAGVGIARELKKLRKRM